MSKYFVVTVENNKKSYVDKIYPTFGKTNKHFSLIPEYENQYLQDIKIFYYKGKYINSDEELIEILKESDYNERAFEFLSKENKNKIISKLT